MKLLQIAALALSPFLFSCGTKTTAESEPKELPAPAITISKSPTKLAPCPVTEWILDTTASRVTFTIKNMGMTVDGSLGGMTGSLLFDPEHLDCSKFQTSVSVKSLHTGIGKRDRDLMAENFFNEPLNKQMSFTSDSLRQIGGSYNAYGTLTIKGTSHHIVIPFSFEQKGAVAFFKGTFSLDRLDYGVGKDGPLMSQNVVVSIEVVGKKALDVIAWNYQ